MQRMSSKDEQLIRASALFDGQCRQMSQEDFDLLASDEVRSHLKHWALIGSALRHELPAQIDPNFSEKVMAQVKLTPKAQSESSDDLPSLLTSKSAFRAGLARYARANVQADQMPSANDDDLQDQAVGAYEQKAVGAYEQKAVGAYQPKMSVGSYELPSVGAYNVSNVGSYEFQANIAYDQPFTKEQSVETPRKSGWLNLKRIGVFATQIAIAASVALVAVVGVQTYRASDISIEQPASTAFTNNSAIGGLSLATYTNNDNDVLMHLNTQDSHPAANQREAEEIRAELKQQQQQEIERINMYVKGYVFDTAAN